MNYGHLLQAAISKRFWAQTRRFHYWIGLEKYYNLHIKNRKRNWGDMILTKWWWFGLFQHPPHFSEVITPKMCNQKTDLETNFFGLGTLYWIVRYAKLTGFGFLYGLGQRIWYLMSSPLSWFRGSDLISSLTWLKKVVGVRGCCASALYIVN